MFDFAKGHTTMATGYQAARDTLATVELVSASMAVRSTSS